MEETEKESNGSFIDPRFTYSPWERECLQHYETDPDAEARLLMEKQAILDSLWASFQNAAKSVAQLYKESPTCRCRGSNMSHTKAWSPFQDAANKVTVLYKDGNEAFMLAAEYGRQLGYQKRNRDVLKWAKTRRKHVRREDLISFLCGRTSPRRRPSESRTGFASLSVSPKPTSDELFSTLPENIANDINDSCSQVDGRKRNFSNDIVMESPSHKRQRFC